MVKVIFLVASLLSVDAARTEHEARKTLKQQLNAVSVSGNEEEWWSREHTCGRVEGAVAKHNMLSTSCECPENTVITGESPSCKAKEERYSRTFRDDSDVGKDGTCKCAFKQGCGKMWYDVDDVIPENAAKKGLPPPLVVGTRDNINTGIEQLDKEYYGIWWMRHNPVPEELASMAGAFSRYSGQNISVEDAKWPVVVEVPNAEHNRWAWADNFQANYVIMPQYYWSDGKANFTMHTPTWGEIPTGLKTMPLVWVERWTLEKLDDDTWLRRTTFQNGSLFAHNNYTLTRIITEEGQPTKYFPAFKEHMKVNMSDSKLQVWDSDNSCKRKCMHRGNSCHYCHECCTGGSDGGPKWHCRHGW